MVYRATHTFIIPLYGLDFLLNRLRRNTLLKVPRVLPGPGTRMLSALNCLAARLLVCCNVHLCIANQRKATVRST